MGFGSRFRVHGFQFVASKVSRGLGGNWGEELGEVHGVVAAGSVCKHKGRCNLQNPTLNLEP